jgi:subtilisin
VAKAKKAAVQRYVVLPPRGLQSSGEAGLESLGVALRRMDIGAAAGVAGKTIPGLSPAVSARVKVVDSIHEDGAKLVEMSSETMLELRAAQPGLRIVPEVFYEPMVFRPEVVSKVKKKAATGAAAAVATKIVLTVRSKADKSPLKGVRIVAFTNFALREGLEGTTNAQGKVSLAFGTPSQKLDRLYVLPDLGFWGGLRTKITIKTGTIVDLDPIALTDDDCVRHVYGRAALTVGAGVTVGVVDSGIDISHPDLKVAGGQNTVVGETAGDFGDNGGHHGTHVGGIVAARGAMPGVAPGVALRSYRVFAKHVPGQQDRASNFAISKAIDRAVADQCDLINMSLGGGDPDDATRSAIADARAAGTLVIVAAGNDGRQAVSFPASDPRSVAVSAMGRAGTFPAGSEPEGDVQAPFGKDKADFVAAFSNIGPPVDVTGPGVGVVSTVPGGYAIMSGTSMACPAITGATARLLAASPTVLAMPRDQARSDAIAKLLFQAAKALGFGTDFEGQGLPR